MWIKNIETDVVWYVTEEHAKKLLKGEKFEEVTSPIKKTEKKKKDKEPADDAGGSAVKTDK
ncbi:hypothetical protein P8917_00950 [Bacillus atrophaeus]|uniref:hypothetical protein n=1 Tax=Bacillus atrophaeus TaxID=1452 RepID=UPI00227E1FA8|nr:hypothetical protein [Bacillus atrophaeus]MCY8813671.1 hypothetical protein [Bacillus atrophaeus]MCY8820256.1 hypothetical protein [Bacillus atrophaeus]MCY8828620.1 hypothetical protein [Bacillus atrophaeus]MCY8832707.1 hypothetical protein [Bacillus atrophaeus]MEC0749759.1 hypothetical protein [Bacillus atrophaeus]